MEGTVEYNFKPFVQGIDWSRSLVFKTNGVVDTLTNWTAAMTIRDEPNSGGTSILNLSTVPNANGSVITITAGSGMVTIFIADADTDNFTSSVYYYDLKMIGPVADGSLESVPIRGKLTIIPKVTA